MLCLFHFWPAPIWWWKAEFNLKLLIPEVYFLLLLVAFIPKNQDSYINTIIGSSNYLWWDGMTPSCDTIIQNGIAE